MRDPERPADQLLSDIATAWLEALPANMRPLELCAKYPRVANRIALCWADRLLTHRLFDDLLIDRRGGRRGFPLVIAAELARLREFRGPRPIDHGQGDLWAMQATSDR